MSVVEKENRIKEVFKNKEEESKIMSLFLTAGYPDLDSTVELVLGFEKNGADLIELGMPFSDPLADGPTIQHSSEIAIKNGITMDRILTMVAEIRDNSNIPLVLMGYINPILNYGVERFCKNAAEAGADGVIIPDIPPEESGIIEKPAQDNALQIIYLIAPNTSEKRMRMIDKKSEGFVYCVSVTGVTGAREGDEVASSVHRFINRVNQNITRNPRMIGFGIRSFEDAQRIAAEADGFIVGSALIDCIQEFYPKEGWKDKIYEFVHTLKYGN